MNASSSFCTQCGTALKPGASFCEQCGQRITAISAAPATVVPMPVPTIRPTRTSKSGCRSCALILVLIIAALAGGAAMYREQLLSFIRSLTKQIEVAATSSSSSPISNVRPPVEVAYTHFLDEAHRRLGGNLSVGSPIQTATRIEVRVVANGKAESLVVLQQTNDGRVATVVVGPKDAGAARLYTLMLAADGWTIREVKDLDG